MRCALEGFVLLARDVPRQAGGQLDHASIESRVEEVRDQISSMLERGCAERKSVFR